MKHKYVTINCNPVFHGHSDEKSVKNLQLKYGYYNNGHKLQASYVTKKNKKKKKRCKNT